MKKRIKVELLKMIKTRSFWVAFGFVMLFPIGDFAQQMRDHFSCSVFEKWMAMPYDTYASRIFLLLYPVLASMPYAWSMAEELRTGYAVQLLTREKRSHYFCGKLVASFISGGSVISLALLLNLYLLVMSQRTFLPASYDLTSGFIPGSFLSIIHYTHPFIFSIIWLMVSFLWGGAFGMLCCAIGFFVKRKYLLVPLMLIIYIGQAIAVVRIPIYRWFYRIHLEWYQLTAADTPGLNPEWTVLGNVIFIILIAMIIVYFKGRKYEAL